jgi:peptidylprolyl isomerase
MLKTYIVILLLLISLSACSQQDKAIEQISNFINKQAIDKTSASWKTSLSKPPLLTFDSNNVYSWRLETTHGNLNIDLFTDTAPMHVSSTIYLSQLGFYDNLTFHRVIPGFMAQGGDPLGNGRGNPGYRYDGEFNGGISHSDGKLLSMANAGPGTDGSQFFLTFTATPFLDGKHTVFGKIVDDVDNTLEKIESLGSRSGRTTDTIKIIKTSIVVTKK